jgi:hygromycin-B 7''-O-kinase
MSISRHDAATILAEVDSAERLEAVEPMAGLASPIVGLRCAGGQRLVVKTFSVERPWQLHQERFVYQLIRTHTTVPVPDVLRCDDTKQLIPFDYMVMSRLPGAPIVARTDLSRAEVQDVYGQLGAILRMLHTVTFEHYGFITPTGVVPPLTNNEFMTRRFGEQLRVFADSGGQPQTGNRIEGAVTSSRPLFAANHSAVLCHNDLHEANALAVKQRGRWHVTGVIDVGGAIAGDPLFDLARTHYWSTKGDPQKQEALVQSYRPARRGWREALNIYRLYHALELRNWLARHGRSPMLTHLDEELERLTQ